MYYLNIKRLGMGRVLFMLGIVTILCNYMAKPVWADLPQVTADAAVLMDAKTGQVYFAKNIHKQRAQASLTKITTALVALELGNPADEVTITQRAQNIYVGQQINLKAGEKIALEQLIKAALIYSANDSTVAIAEHVGFTHDHFVQLMNQKAFVLGAHNTRFVNTNGYSVPNHHSTAYDIAVMTRAALQNPIFAEMVQTKQTTLKWADSQRTRAIANTNSLLRDGYPGVDGVKTGTTARAGNCVVASATRNDQQLIAVVLHSRNRFNEAAKLLEYGFNEFTEQRAVAKGENFGQVKVIDGKEEQVSLITNQDLALRVPDDGGNVTFKVQMPASVTAPIEKGQQLGTIEVQYNEQPVGQVPLVAEQQVNTPSKLYKLFHGK